MAGLISSSKNNNKIYFLSKDIKLESFTFYCPNNNCNKLISNRDKFCSKCGLDISSIYEEKQCQN